VARGALPAIGSLPAIGAGAELGGAAGLAVGGPIGGLVGGVAGGFAGAIGGGSAISAAQHYALSKLPESWTEALGMSDRQEKLDQEYHGTASFLGGLAPYAMTMRPGAVARAKLPENATALQRIMANPATARVFGGAAMGGMEAGQEIAEGQPTPDWTKVAISTGFGMVFNKPTRIGEAITEMGARPARRAMGLAEAPRPATTTPATTTPATEEPAVEAPPASETPAAEVRPAGIAPSLFHAPTVADAADLGIMGPGQTEQTFQGSHEPDENAVAAARETKRTEQAVIGPSPAPDVHSVARQMDFETFAEYERLKARRRTLATEPGATEHLAATEAEMAKLEPQVQAATRRAAEATGAPIHELEAPAPVPGIERQRATIADDITTQLMAAGRPQEEAEAAGQLVAAHYIARATHMGGELGTPEELYRREGAIIRGQQVQQKRMSLAPTRARANFQENMLTGQDRMRQVRNEGGASPYRTFKTAEERTRGMSKEELKAVKDAYEDSIEALEPHEQPAAKEEFTLENAKDMATSLTGLFQRGSETQAGIKLNPNKVPGRDFLGVEGTRAVMYLTRASDASSAMHEFGHEWLAHLMRDSVHPAAPNQIKTDALTVLKWFGVDSPENIERRHHEKFARGFEQYLREGHAPSPELRGVFERFKAWLTAIYNAAKGNLQALGKEISPDIRAVFDRLLVGKPRATVIAAERAHQPTLAEIHTEDAAHIPAHEADAAGDRIAAEAEQYYSENGHAPEYETADTASISG
jgi:hypothetical protein